MVIFVFRIEIGEKNQVQAVLDTSPLTMDMNILVRLNHVLKLSLISMLLSKACGLALPWAEDRRKENTGSQLRRLQQADYDGVPLVPFCRKGHVAIAASLVDSPISQYNTTDSIYIFGGFVVNYDNPRHLVARDLWSLRLETLISDIESMVPGEIKIPPVRPVWMFVRNDNVQDKKAEGVVMMLEDDGEVAELPWPSRRWMAASTISSDGKELIFSGGEKYKIPSGKGLKVLQNDLWRIDVGNYKATPSCTQCAQWQGMQGTSSSGSERVLRRRGHKMVQIDGSGEVIVAGGEVISSDDYSEFECSKAMYALRIGDDGMQFRELIPLPGRCRRGFSVAHSGDRILYFGGRVVSTPTARGSNATTDAERELVSLGGGDLEPATNELWEIRVRVDSEGQLVLGDKWVQIGLFEHKGAAVWPLPRDMHAAAFSEREQAMFIFGGRDSLGYALSDLWEYRPVGDSGRWIERHAQEGPRARYMHSMNVWHGVGQDHLVVFGGQQYNLWNDKVGVGDGGGTARPPAPPPNDFSMANDVWVFTPQTNRWLVASYGGCGRGESGLKTNTGLNNLSIWLLIGVGIAWLGGIALYKFVLGDSNLDYTSIPGGGDHVNTPPGEKSSRKKKPKSPGW